MAYFTLKNEAEDRFEEKKSIFIGHVKRVDSEKEAKEFIDKVKAENKEARHNVFAYIIGENMGIQRYSDDGEPKGTGGIPVLEVIKKNNITDVVVVVTRYFGGILLGAGGLTRAYSKGAAIAIKKGEIVEKVLGQPLYIQADYDLLGKLQYHCNQNELYIEETTYTDKVTIMIYCESVHIEKIKGEIINITSGKATLTLGDKSYYFKLNNRLYSC